jgi:hypothetical protein
MLAEHILKNHDIVAVQEHWLHRFEDNFLTDMCKNLNKECVLRCADDREPISLYQRPRGHAGVALIWDSSLSPNIIQVKEGCDAVFPILIKDYPRDLCLINVYMPCRGSHTELEFAGTLDTLHELLEKYGASHRMVIMGDFNASLLDHRGPRDSKFEHWCSAHGISLPPDYPLDATHQHHRGKGESTIDYILAVEDDTVSSVRVITDCPKNTSSHQPVSAQLKITSGLVINQEHQTQNISTPSINWDKCDSAQYTEMVNDLLPAFTVHDERCTQAYCESISEVLSYASEQSAPRLKAPNRKQRWNGETSRAMAANKKALEKWRIAGRPRDGVLWDNRKESKWKLRQALRQANAEKRNQLFTEVMTASSRDTKLFHKLIQQQRSTISHVGSKLRVDGELITSKTEILHVWTDHFSALATCQDSRNDMTAYDKLVEEDLLVMDWGFDNDAGVFQPVERSEVVSALKMLKCNKAPDLHGIKAEHLKNAGPVIIDALTALFNANLQHGLSDHIRSSYIIPIHTKR